MTDRQLRRLSRKGLLEVLIAQTKETEKYKAQAEALQKELDGLRRNYSEIGSLAGEALKVGGVFEAAQKAADMYISEIKRLKEEAGQERGNAGISGEAESARLISEAEAEAERIVGEAKKEAEELIGGTKKTLNERIRQVNEYAASVTAQADAYGKAHPKKKNQSEKQENAESESEDE